MHHTDHEDDHHDDDIRLRINENITVPELL